MISASDSDHLHARRVFSKFRRDEDNCRASFTPVMRRSGRAFVEGTVRDTVKTVSPAVLSNTCNQPENVARRERRCLSHRCGPLEPDCARWTTGRKARTFMSSERKSPTNWRCIRREVAERRARCTRRVAYRSFLIASRQCRRWIHRGDTTIDSSSFLVSRTTFLAPANQYLQGWRRAEDSNPWC